jgi:hypothetical protein
MTVTEYLLHKIPMINDMVGNKTLIAHIFGEQPNCPLQFPGSSPLLQDNNLSVPLKAMSTISLYCE